MTISAKQIENGEPASLQTTASPSIRHERTGSTVNAATTSEKRLAKLMPFRVSSRTRPSARWAPRRNLFDSIRRGPPRGWCDPGHRKSGLVATKAWRRRYR